MAMLAEALTTPRENMWAYTEEPNYASLNDAGFASTAREARTALRSSVVQ
ncbi:MAG: hypothetical protein ABIT91_12770 [Gemmatimonadaceae bacterium]